MDITLKQKDSLYENLVIHYTKEKELVELKSELFKLRFQLATNGLENPMKIKNTKKDIAKIKTILKERELEESAE